MTYIEIDISRAGFVEAFGSNWGGLHNKFIYQGVEKYAGIEICSQQQKSTD